MSSAPDADQRRAFPWGEVMAAGLGVLRLHPKAFWSMTLIELQVVLGVPKIAPAREGPPPRNELDRLMARFPDRGGH